MANLSDIAKDFGTFSGNVGLTGIQGIQGVKGATSPNGGGAPILTNVQSGNYTLTSGDLGKIVCGINTVTIPPNVFSVGSNISIASTTNSEITIKPGSGVTLRQSGDGIKDELIISGKTYCSLLCVAANNFTAIGNFKSQLGYDPLSPLSSPSQAQNLGYVAGSYYFKSGSMSSAQLLEYQPNYYGGYGWVCVFRSPYSSTATTNKIDLSIPMGGLLVQRDTLDIRAAVYWSTPITYNSVGGSGNNTANSGYSPRRVMLGFAGGHGIYNTAQSQCNWGDSSGAVGAGWNGSTCGSFPNGLIWGTGQSGTANYTNLSGTWSHWITWS